MKLSRRALLAAGAATIGCAQAQTPRVPLITGVNLAGLEFNSSALPGVRDTNYATPTAAHLDYYRRCGARAVRIPFLWERLQPRLGGEFDAGHWRLLHDLIEATATRGMRLILDPHQYGRRTEAGAARIIGESSEVTAAHFAAFWGELARRCRDAGHVIFGLQNEPHDQNLARLIEVNRGAIAAIRRAGARQLILVPGAAWSGAHSWVQSGNGAALSVLRDPDIAFDVHQFLDTDSSGTHATCATSAGRRLEGFTRWAREHEQRGFLSEFGAGANTACATEMATLLDYVAANRDAWLGWTYWAGGPWWDEDYPLSIEPVNGRDRPQMAVLRRYFE
ncbi:glycoside hydrolase family 5 protein [Terricaulis sp.]|uniref:glycoside hydrolase family 5 protein n=1 Tax=Terricaulis sp. TaxID=2768686 RepID=UPI003782FB0D